MSLTSEFTPLELSELRRQAAVMKADGWRFIQTHAANGDDGVDLYYSFMKDGHVVNYRIASVKDEPVPTITDLFLAAFVFENEARELFGVDMRDIAIDFQGGLYAPAIGEPMTIISPEMKAAREKAAKVAAAKAAKEAGSAADTAAAPVAGKRVFKMTPELQARLDAKLPTLSPEKRAKVEAALKARAEEAAAAESGAQGAPESQAAKPASAAEDAPQSAAKDTAAATRDAVLEDKLAALDPEKAAKVRAALEGKAGVGAVESTSKQKLDEPPAEMKSDEQLENLIAGMDEAKAAVVRAALNAKGGE